MAQILTNNQLKEELQVDYSYRTVNKESIDYRKYNIDAFNKIERTDLKYGQKEKLILLYNTLQSEKIYIQLPGKESAETPNMPFDFRPKLQLCTGEFISDISFGTIWDILDKIGREHKAYLSYVATIFLRMGYLYGYVKENCAHQCLEIDFNCSIGTKYREVDSINLSWYKLELSDNIWYTLNDKIGWIALDDGKKVSFEGFVKLVDLLFQNEDCKYYYRNVIIKNNANYKYNNGRTNSSAANLLILNYLEGNEKISKLLDAFQKSRGVPAFPKRKYSMVTDGIVVNIDFEKRKM